MSEILKSATMVEKEAGKLPEGAVILKKSVRTEVEEIENGYILRRSFDIDYSLPDQDGTKYLYYSKKYFSKKNPMTLKLEGVKQDKDTPLHEKL